MPTPTSLLTRLEATRLDFGSDFSERKIALLRQLQRARLTTAAQVLRLHEHVCFMQAHPDDSDILREAEKVLAGFARRSDLLRHRQRLADSGIAGTDIHYPFFWPTARWLTARWPKRLSIDWDQVGDTQLLATSLPLLVSPLEANWLRVSKPPPREALSRLSGREATDAAFVVRRVESMPGDGFTREAFYESLALPLVLHAGADTPSRTHARHAPARVYFSASPPSRGRPDLRAELDRPPRSVRTVPPQEGERLIDLAREAMVTRGRDLDTFAYGDPRDVRLVDDGGGLTWAMIGLIPERRPTLRTAYGYLTLRNGVPIGYAQSDTLWRSVDLAFNTFDTFRGGDSATILARTMSMMRHVFDGRSFTLEPYQLGEGNDEGISSGAWWFYYKLGFRPRNARIRTLVRAELARMNSNPRHRSSPATLAKLASEYLYFEFPGVKAPYWPRLAALGAQVARLGSTGGAAWSVAAARDDKAPRADIQLPRRVSTTARAAWVAWAPIVALIPGLEQWSDDQKHELVRIILAKGGRRDSDYLRLFDRHPKLGDALRQLTRA
jgi:hypothetical protein